MILNSSYFILIVNIKLLTKVQNLFGLNKHIGKYFLNIFEIHIGIEPTPTAQRCRASVTLMNQLSPFARQSSI